MANGQLVRGVGQLQSEPFVVGQLRTAEHETIGAHAGTFDHQVDGIGEVSVLQDEVLHVFGDTEPVFMLLGIVCATEIR